jgi:threonine dehydrogenase-like Zn-dependent dehydrogenase
MKASVSKQYGTPKVFEMANVAKPIPQQHEVLVRIYAATVPGSDLMMRKGKPYVGRLYLGLRKPKTTILGFDFAGEIVETGKNVTSFKVGDQVFGSTTALGCYAEYTCVRFFVPTEPSNLRKVFYDFIFHSSRSYITVGGMASRRFLVKVREYCPNRIPFSKSPSGKTTPHSPSLSIHGGWSAKFSDVLHESA